MKSSILQNIKKHKPAPLPLPELKAFPIDFELLPRFCEVLSQGGARSIFSQGKSIQTWMDELFPKRKKTASTLLDFVSDIDLSSLTPRQLQDIDICILPAQLGVAENGAIYLDEQVMVHRVLPFICQHLVLVLNKKDIVGNMHQAYDKIKLKSSGFGVFIAGPSKTADIEQALVIGAQGARSLTVIVMED